MKIYPLPWKLFPLAVIICLVLIAPSNAQTIKLTNSKNGNQLLLEKGTRISYRLTGNYKLHKGELLEITQDSIKVKEEWVAIKNINSIGKKKKGSTFWTFISASFGGAMIGTALAPEPDICPSCTTVIVEDNGGTAGDIIMVAAGVGLGAIAINTAIKNTPKIIADDLWHLEVVELEKEDKKD